MADISEAVGQLAEVVKEMRVDRVPPKTVPPPVVFVGFQGQIDIINSFSAFDHYWLVLYKKDLTSWLAVLPSFLDGEVCVIDRTLGYGAECHVVKQRLIEEFSHRKT